MQYTVHFIPDGKSLVQELNNLASEGWRLHTINSREDGTHILILEKDE